MGMAAFGVLLKQYRQAAGLTQEGLAEEAGLSVRAISDLERGVNRTPRYDTLDRLAGALRLSPEERATLFAAARPSVGVAGASETAVRPSEALRPAALPIPPTPLVGRDNELVSGIELLGGSGGIGGTVHTGSTASMESVARREGVGPVRLLTLIGPAGVGKTRLALQIARELRHRMAEGAAFVNLAPVRDPMLVPQVVAQALGVREEPGLSISEQVHEYLRDKQYLLLLDNFEQVLDASAFVGDLIAGSPQLRVLVTSRAPLRLRAEHQLPLAPLSLESASALFYLRAQSQGLVLPNDGEALALVETICQRVDRLPLAIELTAANLKVLSLPVLLDRLGSRLQLLRQGARDLPERQRTMHEAIAWSYDLLGAGEQRIFRALGVFAGGCTLEAAEAVCSVGKAEEGGSPEPDNVLSGLMVLVDASLVQSETARDGTTRYNRYSMLEVIRDYALEQLRILGEEAEYSRRHAEYYAQLAEEAQRFDPNSRSRETQLQSELSNGRAALHWTYVHGEVALGLRLAMSFGQFWFRHGQMEETGSWLEKLLDVESTSGGEAAPPSVRGKALYAAARHAMTLGMSDRAVALAKEAVALAGATGDQVDLSRALAILGSVALEAGREEEAANYFTRSNEAAIRSGDLRAIALAELNLGEIARKRGEFERATTLLEESLSLMRSSDLSWGIADTVTLLGHLARQQGKYEQAEFRYRESLELYNSLGDATHAAWCLEGVAALLSAEQRYACAALLCSAAAALRAAVRTPLPPTEQQDFDVVVRAARAGLGERLFAQEWKTGATMGKYEAISYALHILAASPFSVSGENRQNC